MHVIKLFFISIIVLSVFLTGFSALFPPHLHIARNINVTGSKAKILAIIDDLHTWNKWNKIINDTTLTNLIISRDGQTATSDQLAVFLGKDSLGGIAICCQKHNGKQFKGGFKLMELSAGHFIIQWYFDFTFKWYPWEKFGSLVFDKQFQPVMEESLNKLKQEVENNP
jgi:hypothetical protein